MSNHTAAQRVGTTIRELREIRQWSQDELAQRSGCRSSSICHWEQGHYFPNMKNLIRVAAAFDATASDLLNDAGL